MSFGDVALEALTNISSQGVAPPTAWELAAQKIFSPNSTCIKKSCPKNAFLGLCEEGLLRGVEKRKYTRSNLNKAYAVKAVEILKEKQNQYKPKELWIEVLSRRGDDVKKAHNSQMDVVVALWGKGWIV